MYIKVFGERCSGTTYLSKLLRKNIVNAKLHPDYHYDKSGWKHGFPRFIDSDTLYIFIIRDLKPWLLSMYNNPHHYCRPTNMDEFINLPLRCNDYREDHDTNKYAAERQKIIDVRCAKIRSYLEFVKKIDKYIFINLESLLKDYRKFLYYLQDFGIELVPNLSDIDVHAKISNSSRTRIYLQQLPAVESDPKIEKFVEDLKLQISSSQNMGSRI